MTQYTSDYGFWMPKILIWAKNLGYKLFLLQKERVDEVFGCVLRIRVVSVMGESVYQETESAARCVILTTQHKGVEGLIFSVFPRKLSLPFFLEMLYFKNKIFLEKRRQKQEGMNTDEGCLPGKDSQNRHKSHTWFCRTLVYSHEPWCGFDNEAKFVAGMLSSVGFRATSQSINQPVLPFCRQYK